MSKSINKYWLMALPLVFLIHDLEEMITVVKIQTVVLSIVPANYHSMFQISTPQFVASISLLLVGVLIVTLLGLKRSYTPLIRNLVIWILSFLWINSLTHILQALFIGNYVPALVTALFLVMLYSMVFIHKINESLKVSLKSNLVLIVMALESSPPIIFFSLHFGKMLVKSFGC